MKKYILIFAVLFVLLLSSFIFLPYIFKDRIISAVKKQANKNLTVQLDFSDDIGINIFRSFPDLSLTLRELSLLQKDTSFTNDTFFYSDEVNVSFDLVQFYKEQEYIFKTINIASPRLHLESVADSIVNWDIVADSETEESEDEFRLQLEQIKITAGTFTYLADATKVSITGIDHISSGEYKSDKFDLKAETHADKIKVSNDGILYLDDWEINQQGTIGADLANETYSFPENLLRINGLPTDLDGDIKLTNEDIIFDLKASAASPDLNELLTLIPAIYTSDYKSIKTRGEGSFLATLKGTYNETLFPAYRLQTQVRNGWFKYPDVPTPVENLNMAMSIYSADGNTDNTVINIENINFKVVEDPIAGKLVMTNIFNSPRIDGSVHGKLNLDNISQIVPLKKMVLKGQLAADIDIKGNVEDIKANAVDRFYANGSISTNQFYYQSENMNTSLTLSDAMVNVTNQTVRIDKLEGKLGKNDVNFRGKFTNFFSYLFSDETLDGSAVFTSSSFDLNDFYTESNGNESSKAEMTIIEIPGNLKLNVSSSIQNLVYDDLVFSNFNGDFIIENQKFIINDLASQLLGGSLNLRGEYAYDPSKPNARFELVYSAIQLADLFKKFKVVSAFAPVAEKLTAISSAKLNFSSALNQNMSPVLRNTSIAGALNLINVDLDKIKILEKIDQKLGNKYLSMDKMKNVLLKFNIVDGKLLVEPFDVNINQARLSLEGVSKLDGSLAYSGALKIPSVYVKNETAIINDLLKNSQLENLELKPNEYLDLGVSVTGSFKDPKVNLDLQSIKRSIYNTVEDKIKEELDSKKEELEDKAQNEVDELKKEAEKRAEETKKKLEEELRKKKEEAEEKLRKETEERLRKEAEARKKKLEEEANKKLKDIFKR